MNWNQNATNIEQRNKCSRTIIWAICLVILSIAGAYFICGGYGLDGAITSSGDELLGEALVKSIQENGFWGYYFCNRLGAPDGSSLIDTPFLDWIYVFEVRIICTLIKTPLIVNCVLLWIGYGMASLTMFCVLKRIKISSLTAFVISLLFSFSTYHTFRWIGHGTLSNYFMVPIAIYLAFYILNWQSGECWLKRLPVYILAVLLGWTNIYFVAFGLICMAMAVIYRLVRQQGIKNKLAGVRLMLLTLCATAVSLMPKMIYCRTNGENDAAVIRFPYESEMYGLKIIQMLLPASFSKIGNMIGISEEYNTTNPYVNENSFAALGIICSVVFLCLCGYLIVNFADRNRKGNQIFNYCSLCMVALVLFCTVGGFGTLFSYFVTPELRACNRVSIYIICLCLMALACFIDRKIRRLQWKIAFLAGLLLIASVDQISISGGDRWDSAEEAAVVCEEFYGTVEEDLDEGDMVYQIPFVHFPEVAEVDGVSAYTQLDAYVFTDTIRWSHGGMNGRNTTAESLYVDNGVGDEFLNGILESGFKGVCVYLAGYTEEEQQAVISYYSDELELEPIISSDGMRYFYNLTDME